jgi:hypothetical protein
MTNKIYKNSTEIAQVSGVPIYMNDVVDACLMGRLNLFLQGDTGSGKTQLAADAMSYFPGKSLFVLGRNDMDVRELFQQINLDKMRSAKSSQELKELTDKINYNLTVVDELPNCVPAVRAQLFNLFDGYIELNGQKYDIGNGYSVGIATGNIGQKFTESSNELGRALKDRMHVIIDTDHYKPQPSDTLEILAGNTNPRVEFIKNSDKSVELIAKADALKTREVPFEKYIVATYLTHGLDYCTVGGQPASKTKIKDAWPNNVDNNAQGSDEALILPVSMRAAKSIIKLSQAFDEITKEKGAKSINPFSSMMQAYKLVSAYSGVLNDAAVQANYSGDKYAAMDAIITTTNEQFEQQKDNIAAGLDMANKGKLNKRVTDLFIGRWGFMKNTLEGLIQNTKSG